uniref:Uncharacterized protein n=2 Tax=Aegilops tauschii subsp. strangulata TaxID=200361 RepID=A0A453QNE6_AEGTS
MQVSFSKPCPQFISFCGYSSTYLLLFSTCKISKLSSSRHTYPTWSLPIGSVPKSFPPFEHPSHQLLEKNKFHSSNKGSFLNN